MNNFRSIMLFSLAMVCSVYAWGQGTATNWKPVGVSEALLPLACQEYGAVKVNASVTGQPLAIGGRSFRTGYGAHASGLIPLDVPHTAAASMVRFTGWVGIDDDVNKDEGDGAVFVIFSGSTELWRSPVMKRHMPAQRFELTLPPGITRVYLQTLAGKNVWSDHCDWCDLAFRPILGAEPYTGTSQERLAPPAGTADAGPALRAALARLQRSGAGGTLELAKGTYHLYVDSAPRLSFHISNNDHPAVHPVALPLVNMRKIQVKGNGSKFILHGSMMATLVMDSLDTTISGIDFEYVESQLFNATVVGFANGKTNVKIDANRFPYVLEGNRLFFTGHGGLRMPMQGCMAFDHRTGEIIERTADLGVRNSVTRNPDGTLALPRDLSKVGAGMKVGDVLAIRYHGRDNPTIVIYRAKNTLFEDVVVRNSFAMSLVGQRSENITFRGTGKAAERRAGMFAPDGMIGSIDADATHFSNCRGLITVENCYFEGMMDDAINVHSTCLSVREKLAPNRIRCRYMHGQSIGFETFLPGETLRFIKGPVLENGWETKVTSVKKLDEREIEITLAADIPALYTVGDAVENADWQPAVNFLGNIVKHNRARGCLFTTPGRVVVRDNLFDRVSGSAILFAGDAQSWFESGACQDVLVENNVFRNNLTSHYGGCDGILSFWPEVKRPNEQKKAYHANILIRHNRFETFDVPIIYAHSTDNVRFEDNDIIYNRDYRGWGRKQFDVKRSTNFTTRDNHITGTK